MKILIMLFLLISCAHKANNFTSIQKSKKSFHYKDISGSFVIQRDIARKKNKIINRQQIINPNDIAAPLEKTVTMSKLGIIKTSKGQRRSLRPVASQHSIWFNKKEYFSQLKIIPEKRSLEVVTRSPEDKWNGKELIKFPKGNIFCFFSQVPECLKAHGLLSKLENKQTESINFYIIWDNYPYQNQQLSGVSNSAFQSAVLKYSGKSKSSLKYAVDLTNQTIFYHFDNQKNLENMFWITQGISLKSQEI